MKNTGERRTRSVVLAALACLAAAGCDGHSDEVRSYAVPSEPSPRIPAPAQAPQSVSLPAGTLHWEVPEGWTPVPNTNTMRFATLMAGEGEDSLEVAITQLTGAAGGIAANINRWRGQVGLPPAGDEELAQQAQRVTSREGAPGIIVDLIGPGEPPAGAPRMLAAIFPTETHSWFIKAMGSSDVVERHRAKFVTLCESVGFDGGAAVAAMPPQSPPPAGMGPGLSAGPSGGGSGGRSGGPAWDALPDGWTADAQARPMSVVSFTVSGGGQEAALTITPLGGDQDLLANINRWRRQLGLPPLAGLADDPPQPIEVAGAPGSLVDLGGPEGRTLAVIAPRGGMTWFYKLSGPDPLVESQRDAFEAFVRSVRFDGGGGSS